MSRWVLALVLTVVALGAAAWLAVSVGEMHDRLAKHSARWRWPSWPWLAWWR